MEKEYTISWLERKEYNGSPFIVATTGEGTDVTEFTIWKKDKSGVEFPDFDNLGPGSRVKGNMWTNPKTGKLVLYPPKPQTSSTGANRGQGGAFRAKQIAEHEANKQGFIKDVVHSKEESIKLAGAQRDAVLLTQTLYGDTLAKDPVLSEDEKVRIIKNQVIAFRDWLLSDAFQETLPFSVDGTN